MKSSVSLIALMMTMFIQVAAQIGDFQNTDFSKADSLSELYAAHSLEDLKGLADKLTVPLPTEQEKFRAIFKWVCSNIEVDYSLVISHKQNSARLSGPEFDKWRKEFNRKVFNTLLQERRTLCTGYAYLIRELAFHAGLPCTIINGFAKPGGVESRGPVNHSWNAIKINGRWYVCDATWSSGFFNRATDAFVKKYNNHYFLTDPFVFSLDHIASDNLPSETDVP